MAIDYLQLLGMDPESEKKRKRGAMVDAIGSGLAGIAASFHKGRGAELQQNIASAYDQRVQNREAQRQSSIKELMGAMAPSGTDDIKEFEYAKNQGFGGTLQDWIKSKPAGGAFSLDAMMAPYVMGMMAKMFPNGPGGTPPGPPSEVPNGPVDFTDPKSWR